MEKFKEYAVYAFILIAGVVSYFTIPMLIQYLSNNMHGTKALMIGGGITLVGSFVYYLWGYRGRQLLYVASIIVFLMAMIWLYFNYHQLDVYISSTYGQLAATAFFVLIIVGIWIFIRFFL